MLFDSLFMKCPELANSWEPNVASWVLGAGGNEDWLLRAWCFLLECENVQESYSGDSCTVWEYTNNC